MESKQNMSENLKAMRMELGQTLDDFYEYLDIAQSQTQKYLKGDGNPQLDTIEYIARRLGKHPTAIVGNSSSDYRFQVIDLLLRSYETTGQLVFEERRTIAAQILEMAEKAERVFREKPAEPNSGMEDALLVEIRKYIAAILKAVKTYRGIGLKTFAGELGVSPSHLQDILILFPSQD